MTFRRFTWLSALGITLGLNGLLSAEQPVVWRAATTPVSTPIATLGRPVAASRTRAPATTIIRGQAPDYVPPPEPDTVVPRRDDNQWTRRPAPRTADPALRDVMPTIGAESGITIALAPEEDFLPDGDNIAPRPAMIPTGHTAAQPPTEVPPPPPPTSPVPTVGPEISPHVITDDPVGRSPSFWDKCKGMFGGGGGCGNGGWGGGGGKNFFSSDNAFQGMVSPMTMPFYFEDPRALTEIRPIFMYQGIPNGNPITRGGDAIFFGTQLRLAFGEHWSLVVHELGFATVTPDESAPAFRGGTGFTEFRLGPKWTFFRNPDSGTVMATGLIFEIPAGGKRLKQDTGTLSLDPYFTIGQTFGHLPGGFGSFNLLGTAGASLSVDEKRSEFVYLNFHVDYNIANTNSIYPFFELNWMHYFKSGKSNDLGFDGADLVNLGSRTRQGSDYLSLAGGLRFRISDNTFAGAAIEFPVTREKGMADYRVTLDVIFRY